MNKSNNVIDLRSRLKTKNARVSERRRRAPVLDMTERRNEILTQERRQVRRTILSEFVGACVVVPKLGLQKVAIYDISTKGVSFDLGFEAGQFALGDEVAMRVYMNHQTYFGFVVRITNVRSVLDEGVHRHGAGYVKGTVNDTALHHFVKFIETVSASLQTDSGDIMVSSLKR